MSKITRLLTSNKKIRSIDASVMKLCIDYEDGSYILVTIDQEWTGATLDYEVEELNNDSE